MSAPRKAELAAGLAAVRGRIAAAATAAGRSPADVTLIVVTKTHPVADLVLLSELGVEDVGENRAADLVTKRQQAAALPIRWHFIGQLQRNKAVAVARAADVVHSVDRPALVEALERAVRSDERDPLPVLIQVALDGAPGRGGCPPAEVERLAEQIATGAGLQLRGVMAVAPPAEEPSAAFGRLAAVAGRMRAAHPTASWISAGMSGDLEAAISNGATHVRVGAAILGTRPTV